MVGFDDKQQQVAAIEIGNASIAVGEKPRDIANRHVAAELPLHPETKAALLSLPQKSLAALIPVSGLLDSGGPTPLLDEAAAAQNPKDQSTLEVLWALRELRGANPISGSPILKSKK